MCPDRLKRKKQSTNDSLPYVTCSNTPAAQIYNQAQLTERFYPFNPRRYFNDEWEFVYSDIFSLVLKSERENILTYLIPFTEVDRRTKMDNEKHFGPPVLFMNSIQMAVREELRKVCHRIREEWKDFDFSSEFKQAKNRPIQYTMSKSMAADFAKRFNDIIQYIGEMNNSGGIQFFIKVMLLDFILTI